MYTVLGDLCLFVGLKSQSGTVLDDKGLDYKGNTLTVPYLKQDGNQNFKTFGGFIDIRMCGGISKKAKLVGFTGYSVDDGQTWVRLEKKIPIWLACFIQISSMWFYLMAFLGLSHTRQSSQFAITTMSLIWPNIELSAR
ncbi:hypothetical protein QW180_31335 [Vibrio sinaloensis]|nr:hypothetical protein [Vibrio sinaloensis]